MAHTLADVAKCSEEASKDSPEARKERRKKKQCEYARKAARAKKLKKVSGQDGCQKKSVQVVSMYNSKVPPRAAWLFFHLMPETCATSCKALQTYSLGLGPRP